ncbi:fumarylacetoacetate hydrolase family protein [Actinomadura vinacea]|uniref:Fumarylacetoacetate hydrolase family protein n=1 Tax=Actinomadura vinacea TaxID=115336 RepID=A0ABP5W2L0_9ACTN
MRIARFSTDEGMSFGVVEENTVAAVAAHPFGELTFTGQRHPLADVRLLAPILPSKVIAIGKNYADHVREMGGDEPPAEPVVFAKPSTAVIGPGEAVAYPEKLSRRVDFEGELAVVIGRMCREVPAARAAEVILGYTCANDVTARDLQEKDKQWTRAKGFDTFCPLGPWIETEADPSDLAITTTVNGEIRQDARTSLLLHDVPSLVEYVSQVMTLLPGDVILTGTPAGVGPLEIGDEVTVAVEGVGELTNRVIARE